MRLTIGIRRILSAAAVCVAGCALPGTANAFVLDRQPPVTYGSYYEQNAHIICDTATRQCDLVFSRVPQLLSLKELHCSVVTTSQITEAWLTFNPQGITFEGRGKPLLPVKYYNDSDEIVYSIELKTDDVTGSTPMIKIYTVEDTMKIDLDCQIVGEIQ